MKDTLKVSTSGDRAIVITRDFDAPRELVWQTMSRPELLKRWMFGPPGWEMTVCEEDHRVGGKYRWVWSGPNGGGMTLTGEYREIVPPERVVRTESFHTTFNPQIIEQVATLALAEKDGKTALTLTVEYPSQEARDGALASGMDRGLAARYDRLDEVLPDVAARARSA